MNETQQVLIFTMGLLLGFARFYLTYFFKGKLLPCEHGGIQAQSYCERLMNLYNWCHLIYGTVKFEGYEG